MTYELYIYVGLECQSDCLIKTLRLFLYGTVIGYISNIRIHNKTAFVVVEAPTPETCLLRTHYRMCSVKVNVLCRIINWIARGGDLLPNRVAGSLPNLLFLTFSSAESLQYIASA
jgi:hypothetical protein